MQIPLIDQPKVIGDPIHGYVPLTNLEYELIQLPTMLRLHYIKQTATAYLTFPGSVTTRFSHVIGALYMGDKIIRRLLLRLSDEDYEELFKEENIESIIKSVRLACLFHDVGHGPFSHSAENAMYAITNKYHKNEIKEAEQLYNTTGKKLPIHEYFSYKLVTNGEIKETIVNHPDGCHDLVDRISSLLVKTKNTKFLKKYPLGYSLLRHVVSGQLDADRMDYLLRDSMMSGVKFGNTDVNRIINNMEIVRGKIPKQYEIAIHGRALGNVEDMLDARLKMYKWYYNHHTVTGTNALIEYAINMMINDRPKLRNLFHWKSYATGQSTDDYVLSQLTDLIRTKAKYKKFKGLIDRRFLPVSIFKQQLDYTNMHERIQIESGKHEKDTVVLEKLKTFFKERDQPLLQKLLNDQKPPIKRAAVFAMNFPRTPYSPFSKSDKVFLYGKSQNELRELSKVSDYAVKINEEWKDSPSVFIYYVIPGMKKRKAQKYQKRIRDIIAKAVAQL